MSAWQSRPDAVWHYLEGVTSLCIWKPVQKKGKSTELSSLMVEHARMLRGLHKHTRHGIDSKEEEERWKEVLFDVISLLEVLIPSDWETGLSFDYVEADQRGRSLREIRVFPFILSRLWLHRHFNVDEREGGRRRITVNAVVIYAYSPCVEKM